MGLIKRLATKAEKPSEGIVGKARDLFGKNPLAFSFLPPPLKREALEREEDDALRLTREVADKRAALAAARERGDGLRAQLVDLRRQKREYAAFDLSSARDYKKYLR